MMCGQDRADPRVKLWGSNGFFSLLASCIIERITALIKCNFVGILCLCGGEC